MLALRQSFDWPAFRSRVCPEGRDPIELAARQIKPSTSMPADSFSETEMTDSASSPEITYSDEENDLVVVFAEDGNEIADEPDEICQHSLEQVSAEVDEHLEICQPFGKLCESDDYYTGKPRQRKARRKASDQRDISKKKKWKMLQTKDFDFLNTSLFPRVPYKETEAEAIAVDLEAQVDVEYKEMEEKIGAYAALEDFSHQRACKFSERHLRADRDRKLQKAHKQVKTKYCRSVRNNQGRKNLWLCHRVVKLMELEPERTNLHYPTPKTKEAAYLTLDSGATITPVWTPTFSRTRGPKVAPQNLAHALDENNVAEDIPLDILNLLIALQHRDVTPEDYEVLLRLDDGVAPKTLSDSTLQSFKTDKVDESSVGQECTVCMEVYELGQKRKFLPCGHGFHDECIDTWLKNSSMNCPLDGLPVDS